jgi:DNA-directed RNA polymerase subunit beta
MLRCTTRIVVRVNDAEALAGGVAWTSTTLIKYQRSNRDTNIHQRPPSARDGRRTTRVTWWLTAHRPTWAEVAIGQDMLIGFMPWNGLQLRVRSHSFERVVAQRPRYRFMVKNSSSWRVTQSWV